MIGPHMQHLTVSNDQDDMQWQMGDAVVDDSNNWKGLNP